MLIRIPSAVISERGDKGPPKTLELIPRGLSSYVFAKNLEDFKSETAELVFSKIDLLRADFKQMLNPHKVWFTRSEAAEYLSCSEKSIDRLRLKKRLPYYNMQGTSNIRFKRKDLDEVMD
mgnify:CR=1 FL=1